MPFLSFIIISLLVELLSDILLVINNNQFDLFLC